MSSSGPAAEAARADVRELIAAKGHAVDNARAAVARLETAFADGALVRTSAMDQFLADLLRVAGSHGQYGDATTATRFQRFEEFLVITFETAPDQGE